jgi:proteasome lid subunit RPN8/RPN11
MKIYVRIVKKKWRTKMKNKKTESKELTKAQIRTNLKQTTQRSSSHVNRKRFDKRKRLALRFSPTAWAKLLYFRDKTDNEVGGFGISKPDDLLFVTDFIVVKQEVTAVSVKFEDEAVANFFEDQVDLGRKPEQFARIWLHTHPGDSPSPSITDEETLTRVFGNCQWAIMFILAQDNKTYAKLSFNVGPGGQVLIQVEIDYSQKFGPSNQEIWDAEYTANVKATTWLSSFERKSDKDDQSLVTDDFSSYALPYDFLDEFERMEPAERQFILDELADRPELWDKESEVMFL